jgi:molecular chaperone GrpE (heat shock protein)
VSEAQDYTDQLLPLMQRVGIHSFRQLAQAANVSRWQVSLLKRGQLAQMRLAVLLQLAQVLQVELADLLRSCGVTVGENPEQSSTQVNRLRQEYERLQGQMQQQAETLKVQFQTDAIRVLESWLTYWPTAAYRVEQGEAVQAKQLLPLVKPVERLLAQWGVVALAKVGEEIPFDPQKHDLVKGVANPGELVRVQHTGYQQGDRLILRVKVIDAKAPGGS